MKSVVRVGARPSRLARRQVDEIKSLLPGCDFNEIEIETEGDRDKTTPLTAREKSDFFTRELEEALRAGDIDAAVHSAKDLEDEISFDVPVTAITSAISPLECLVSRTGASLEELRPGSVVGTSSRNRRSAIKRYREDLAVKDIRGNVDDRIRQLNAGRYDAVIVAHAALLRLGLTGRAFCIIPEDIIIPHPMQGRLAVQIRHDRPDLAELFGRIDGRR